MRSSWRCALTRDMVNPADIFEPTIFWINSDVVLPRSVYLSCTVRLHQTKRKRGHDCSFSVRAAVIV
jgi:hypothetical protein